MADPKPVTPTATSSKSAPSSSGFFSGVFGSKSSAVTEAPLTKEKPAPVPASPRVEVASKKTPEPTKPAAASTAAEKPSASFPPIGLFSFGSKSSTAPPSPPVVPKSAPVVAKPAASVAKESPAPPKTSSTSSSLFGLFGSKPAASKVEDEIGPAKATKKSLGAAVVTTPEVTKPKPAPRSMSAGYLTTVNAFLKKDQQKVRAFQRATDEYRSGAIDVKQFISTLEGLFASSDLAAIVTPLAAELPEKDKAKELKTAFEKFVAVGASKPQSSSLFSGLLGRKSPSTTTAPAVAPLKPTPAVTPVKPPAPVIATKPPSPPSKPTVPAKTGVTSTPQDNSFGAAVLAKVPITKKTAVELRLKALVSGSTTVETFYSDLKKTLGKASAKELVPLITAIVSKDKATKLIGLAAADN